MKNLVLQIDIKAKENRFKRYEQLIAFSCNKAEEYANSIGADYFIYTGPRKFQKYSVCMEKFIVFDKIFDEYDKIFLLDTDAVIQQGCPNIFDYNEFSAAPSQPWVDKSERKLLSNYNIRQPHRYFNSGVILFTRRFLDDLKPYYMDFIEESDLIYSLKELEIHDQPILNKIVSEYYNDYKVYRNYNILDIRWNASPRLNTIPFIKHYMLKHKTMFFRDYNIEENTDVR